MNTLYRRKSSRSKFPAARTSVTAVRLVLLRGCTSHRAFSDLPTVVALNYLWEVWRESNPHSWSVDLAASTLGRFSISPEPLVVPVPFPLDHRPARNVPQPRRW